MSRISSRQIAVLAAGAALLMAACGTNRGGPALPDGSYAGSNASDAAVTISVSGGQVSSYDGHSTHAAGNRSVYSRKDRVTISCRSAVAGTELVCSLHGPGHVESIELMKL